MVRESLDIVAGDEPAGDGHLHLQLHRREELLPGVPDCDVQD